MLVLDSRWLNNSSDCDNWPNVPDSEKTSKEEGEERKYHITLLYIYLKHNNKLYLIVCFKTLIYTTIFDFEESMTEL